VPTLNWIGKDVVVNHDQHVPYRLIHCDGDRSVGEAGEGNLLVEGDNLHALKALLPYYRKRVKCIYIDPPYNTGNEGWVYNDNVNAPEIKKWLGETVGGEAEDLSRHDKWLCMMYPRLVLLREFLRDDGAIFISIDDNEVAHLRGLMDEIFGKQNFVTTIIWHKVYAPKGSARHFSESHDYIVVYAKSADTWNRNLIPRSEKQDRVYKNLDNDLRGLWRPNNLAARNYYSLGTYSITCPSGRVIPGPPKGQYWRFSKERLEELDKDGRVWWGKDGNNVPAPKIFLSEVQQGVVPQTIWSYDEVGHTQEAKKDIVALLPDAEEVFSTPKPTRLIQRILQIATDKDSIVLDSFAGSGTTGHAVLQLNKEDGGNRRFILIEMEPEICRNITAERLRRVIEGQPHPPAPSPDDNNKSVVRRGGVSLPSPFRGEGVRVLGAVSAIVRWANRSLTSAAKSATRSSSATWPTIFSSPRPASRCPSVSAAARPSSARPTAWRITCSGAAKGRRMFWIWRL
jgi:adenine-specific DNA-methyltransferase